jgi:hypothetical protein
MPQLDFSTGARKIKVSTVFVPVQVACVRQNHPADLVICETNARPRSGPEAFPTYMSVSANEHPCLIGESIYNLET